MAHFGQKHFAAVHFGARHIGGIPGQQVVTVGSGMQDVSGLLMRAKRKREDEEILMVLIKFITECQDNGEL